MVTPTNIQNGKKINPDTCFATESLKPTNIKLIGNAHKLCHIMQRNIRNVIEAFQFFEI